jgi:hypothetical protein
MIPSRFVRFVTLLLAAIQFAAPGVASVAEGSLGEGPFRRIMTDHRFDRVPKILETPKLSDATATDTRMLQRLRGYAR